MTTHFEISFPPGTERTSFEKIEDAMAFALTMGGSEKLGRFEIRRIQAEIWTIQPEQPTETPTT